MPKRKARILGPDGKPYELPPQKPEPWGAGGSRSWPAGTDNRLNEAAWAAVADNSINVLLGDKLTTIAQRSEHEIRRNPIVAGMIGTHTVDIVGEDGPALQVDATDENGEAANAYAEELEHVWREWWRSPDINEELTGAEFLDLDVNMLWRRGESLTQIVDEPGQKRQGGEVSLRLHTIHPRRLETPSGDEGDDTITLGVRRDERGKPLEYWIDGAIDTDEVTAPADGAWIRRENMVHLFRTEEPGQARGVPWLAAVLQVISDLREFDDETLDAARTAAEWSIVLQSELGDQDPITLNETTEIERRTMQSIPPGYKANAMMPPQPGMNHVEYRHDRMADIGRPVCMPGMLIRLDSSGHNYSSARFDAQIYNRANRKTQAWISRRKLDRLVDLVATEARARGQIPTRVPKRVSYVWTWPVAPHVDPAKEALAEKIRLMNRTLTLKRALAAHGIDYDEHIAQLRREAEELTEAGLSPVFSTGAGQQRLLDAYIGTLFSRSTDEFERQLLAEEPVNANGRA